MAVTLSIWDALLAAVEGINGPGGGYVHDLTAEGAVARVRVGQPMSEPPFATVVFDRCESRRDVQLLTFRRDLFFTIVGWAPVNADTDEARTEAAVNLFDDLLRAVEADLTLGGLVYDVTARGTAFIASDAESGAQYPVAVIDVEVYLRVGTGA